MKSFYGGLAVLSLFALLFFSAVTVAPNPAGRVFFELCRNPTSWDITFRDNQIPVHNLTPEEVKSDLVHFAAVYQSEAEIWMAASMIIALLVFAFSLAGWLRERRFLKQFNANS